MTSTDRKPLVLVVEDDAAVRSLIAATLDIEECRHMTAASGSAAIAAAATQSVDVVLLDLGLPDIDGVEVIRRVRTWSEVPIIVISARSEDSDKILALDSGADDYITKPFSVEELLARVRVVLRRRAREAASASTFENGDLTIDYSAGTASLAGEELRLTAMEYQLLCLLARNVGKVLTHGYILREVWNSTSDGDRASLRVFMASLRKKIETDQANPRYSQTKVGVGSRMVRV